MHRRNQKKKGKRRPVYNKKRHPSCAKVSERKKGRRKTPRNKMKKIENANRRCPLVFMLAKVSSIDKQWINAVSSRKKKKGLQMVS